MLRLRLYTENKNKQAVKRIVSQYVSGYTLYECFGVWHGCQEKSLVFEFIVSDLHRLKELKQIAENIKKLNNQECVLVTSENLSQVLYI